MIGRQTAGGQLVMQMTGELKLLVGERAEMHVHRMGGNAGRRRCGPTAGRHLLLRMIVMVMVGVLRMRMLMVLQRQELVQRAAGLVQFGQLLLVEKLLLLLLLVVMMLMLLLQTVLMGGEGLRLLIGRRCRRLKVSTHLWSGGGQRSAGHGTDGREGGMCIICESKQKTFRCC